MSLSIASIDSKPRNCPRILRIPEPQPISNNLLDLFWTWIKLSIINSMQSLVVSCVPVPKAIPGSM